MDWSEAAELVRQATEAKATRTTNGKGPTLKRLTLDFVCGGASEGDLHQLLYSAARNLAEFGCPPGLAHALLTETALDCGLATRYAHRQLECGSSDQALLAVEQAPNPTLAAD